MNWPGLEQVCLERNAKAREVLGKNEGYTFNPTKAQQRLIRDATPAEKHIRQLLDENRVKYRFQKKIWTGKSHRFIDFWLYESLVVLEVDGNHHSSPKQIMADWRRTRSIQKAMNGVEIARIFNDQVLSDDFTFQFLVEHIYKQTKRYIKDLEATREVFRRRLETGSQDPSLSMAKSHG